MRNTRVVFISGGDPLVVIPSVVTDIDSLVARVVSAVVSAAGVACGLLLSLWLVSFTVVKLLGSVVVVSASGIAVLIRVEAGSSSPLTAIRKNSFGSYITNRISYITRM